jgi:hypothetical protein
MKPALTKHIKLMVERLLHSLVGVRERALLLLGFAGAMRRSDLVSLDVSDLAQADERLVVTIRKSKTDQVRAGILHSAARLKFPRIDTTASAGFGGGTLLPAWKSPKRENPCCWS